VRGATELPVPPNRDRNSPDDRNKVLVAIEPLAYRTIIGNALQALRPRVEVVVVEAEALLVEVACLKPDLVISEFSRPSGSSEIAWTEFRLYNKALASVMSRGAV
jgi:hypothetical protein